MGSEMCIRDSSAADRVRKLEQAGVIRGYAPLLDAESLGYPLVAFVSVTLGSHGHRSAFLRGIEKLDEIVECHHVAGDDDYLLKVRCRGTKDLDRVLARELKERIGVARTRTVIVLSTAKETVRVPLKDS